MALPAGFTSCGSADFERITALGFNQYTATLGVGDISYNTGTAGPANNTKFINLWNNGTMAVVISGKNDPDANIVRLGNYNLRATAELAVTFTTPATQPAPLPNVPPLALSAVESKWTATSLDNARVLAGFSSPVSILDFLGTAPFIPDPEDFEEGTIDDILGFSWTEFSTGLAETGLGTTSVSNIYFYFNTESVSIPTNATITQVRVRARNGVPSTDGGVLAAADFFLYDWNETF